MNSGSTAWRTVSRASGACEGVVHKSRVVHGCISIRSHVRGTTEPYSRYFYTLYILVHMPAPHPVFPISSAQGSLPRTVVTWERDRQEEGDSLPLQASLLHGKAPTIREATWILAKATQQLRYLRPPGDAEWIPGIWFTPDYAGPPTIGKDVWPG